MTRNDMKLPGEIVGNMEDYLMLKRLIEGVFNDIGIDSLLRVIELTLKRPVVITDMGFHIVVKSPSADDTYLFCCKDHVFLDESCTALIRSHYIFSKIREREFISAILTHPAFGSLLVASIKVSDADVLMMIVFGTEFKKTDLVLIKKICQVMSVEFQKENTFNHCRLAIPNHMISAILSGEEIPRREFFDKMSYLKWISSDEFHMMLIADMADDKLDVRISAVIDTLKLYFPIEQCLIYERRIIIYLTSQNYQDICISGNVEFTAFLKNNHLCAAVSTAFPDILDSRYYYETILSIMAIARKKHVPLALFSDMQCHIIADQLEKQFRIQDFCHPAIRKMIQFDNENHTELLITLKNYLIYKNDLNTAIEKLYIHKSTLFYRLKKIKELTGINLEQIEETSSLYFSLKMVELYGEDMFLEFL